jgi:hypothetical protein
MNIQGGWVPPWAAKKGEVSAGLEARGSTVSGGQRGDDQELEQCKRFRYLADLGKS